MAVRSCSPGPAMLRGVIGCAAATLLSLSVLIPQASAAARDCPAGTSPVSIGTGVICVVVTDPGGPEGPGHPGNPGDGGHRPQPVGCHTTDGTEVPCQTADGYWWSGSQCYAAPYDAPPDDPSWQGHTDGSVWTCTRCTASGGGAETCNVQIIWLPTGAAPGPPTPEELAQTALGQLPLAMADVHTAPAAPEPTYVGVENWLWVPESQWSTLTKSVRAGGTTVTVTAKPTEVAWKAGPESATCHGPGRAWVEGMTDAATTTCSVTFDQSSVRQPGGIFAVTAAIRYAVTWACTGNCPTASGDFGLVDAPAGSSQIRVLQRQTVVVE